MKESSWPARGGYHRAHLSLSKVQDMLHLFLSDQPIGKLHPGWSLGPVLRPHLHVNFLILSCDRLLRRSVGSGDESKDGILGVWVSSSFLGTGQVGYVSISELWNAGNGIPVQIFGGEKPSIHLTPPNFLR
jgi:hypothetical protein